MKKMFVFFHSLDNTCTREPSRGGDDVHASVFHRWCVRSRKVEDVISYYSTFLSASTDGRRRRMIDDDAFRIWIWIWIRGRVPWMDGMRARFRRPRCGQRRRRRRRRQKCKKTLPFPSHTHVDSRIFGAAIARVLRSTCTGDDVIDATQTVRK